MKRFFRPAPVLVLFICAVLPFGSSAQFVNGYARVTAISGPELTVANALETYDTFEANEQVILIQVQAATLGNTTNSAAFGSLGSIGSAGLYEVIEIDYVTRTGPNLTSVVLKNAPDVAYDLSNNARLQLVTFPQLGTPHFTSSEIMTCPAWNGNVGGIIAFQVEGDLELRHSIHADGRGFRGGSRSVDHHNNNDCNNSTFRSNSTTHGAKGEGIHRNTNSDYNSARGPMVSGGGGGSSHNGGGGGGSNFTAGGIGGAGWNGSSTGCATVTSGLGGNALSGVIDANRVFFGGGGGGGQQNNAAGTSGGNGGGMVFIKALTIYTPDETCNLRISADGQAAGTGGNDGQGGGGAGGSIVFQVDDFDITSSCLLTVQANGGNGGNVNSSTHAGGGGGGQGTVVYPGPQPLLNLNTTTLNGLAGCDNNTCSQGGQPGQSANNIGILTGMPSVLNALGVDLTVGRREQAVTLDWRITEATEQRAYPTRVERSSDLNEWKTVAEAYAFPAFPNHSTDEPGGGVWYYRAAVDDSHLHSDIRAVEMGYDGPMIRSYFPSTDGRNVSIRFNGTLNGFCRVIAPDGRTIDERGFFDVNQLQLDLMDVATGIYIIEIQSAERREVVRLKLR
ncbi:MAG: hypothetical protein ACFCUH_06420 [Flavobacteriales bacterium]